MNTVSNHFGPCQGGKTRNIRTLQKKKIWLSILKLPMLRKSQTKLKKLIFLGDQLLLLIDLL
jgi:hypothetical protein